MYNRSKPDFFYKMYGRNMRPSHYSKEIKIGEMKAFEREKWTDSPAGNDALPVPPPPPRPPPPPPSFHKSWSRRAPSFGRRSVGR